MNKLQKYIVIWMFVLLAVSIIYVPYKAPSGNFGYSTIFSPLEYSSFDHKTIEKTEDPRFMGPGEVNYERILLQDGAFLLLAIAAIIFAGKKP